MAQTIKLRRSGVEGSVPTTSQLALGEVAINTFDGRAFIHKSGSGPGAPPESIEHLITTNSETTGSINLIGNITASGDISGSGNLYANLSENSSNYNTVVYNTSTGQFYYTGSYGGGSSLTVGGVAGAIQYSDGAGALDYNNTFKWSDIGLLNVGSSVAINIQDESANNLENPVALVTGAKTSFQLSKVLQKGIYANFDKLTKYLMLHPWQQLGSETIPNDVNSVITDEFIASSRFHVIDQYPKAHIAKIINLGDSGYYGKENLLLGTAHGDASLSGIQDTPYHKFVDFQIKCGVHGGESIAGIYYDPTDYLGGGGNNTVKYQGILISPSDKKLKKHITDTSRNIDDIMSMKVKDYRWKGSSRKSKKVTGLIAQDLQETHPELVSNLDDTLNVNYTGIVPMLIKAIQDQQKQIDDLKTQLENYKK